MTGDIVAVPTDRGPDRGDVSFIRQGNGKVWLALLLLAVPFLIVSLALQGLQDQYQTFHVSDEQDYHYPIILEFIKTFPRMQIWDYNSATTPMFHMVAAIFGKLFGSSLPILRMLNVGATYGFAVVIFLLFFAAKRVDYITSLLIAFAMSLSPYVFGTSFILLTDNLAIFFAAVCILFLQHYLDSERWETLVFAVLFASWAILTRQLYLWLLPVIFAAWVMGRRPKSVGQAIGLVALLALCIGPYGLLCVAWGGVNPPLYQQFHALNLGAFGFLTACIGVYGLPLLVVAGNNIPWRSHINWYYLSTGLVACIVMLSVASFTYVSTASCAGRADCFPTDGVLWKLSSLLPSIANRSVVFLFLIPAGVATILFAWQQDRWRSMPVLIYLAFGSLAVANASPFQKYYDPVALLICILIFFQRGRYRRLPAQILLLCYCVVFCLYAVVHV